MRSSIRQSQHYLRQWGYFDQNVELLSELELTRMKTLYTALKHLTEEQRSFLAEKYRVFEGTAIPDHELAKKYNLTLKEYRKLRHEHEGIFRKYLEEVQELFVDKINDLRPYNPTYQLINDRRGLPIKLTLRAARINAGYSLDEASEEFGITREMLNSYEEDSSHFLRDLIGKIESVYAIPPSCIYFGPEADHHKRFKQFKEVRVN